MKEVLLDFELYRGGEEGEIGGRKRKKCMYSAEDWEYESQPTAMGINNRVGTYLAYLNVRSPTRSYYFYTGW